ncbi:hypothetical protein [Streptomyces sp. NRRL F-2664]|nr:hypothetical protein [Streptomyces sp. NRRL F-2664]
MTDTLRVTADAVPREHRDRAVALADRQVLRHLGAGTQPHHAGGHGL